MFQTYTVSQKVPIFKLSVTLSNLNPFSYFFSISKSPWNLLQNPYDNVHLTLGVLLHYLGKLKIQIFCRYSADMEEKASKLHFECTDEYRLRWYVTDSPVGLRFVLLSQDYINNCLNVFLIQCGHCTVCHCLAACQLCLCPATFSTAY